MNALGSKREPFFFMIDFDMEQPVVVPLSDLDFRQIKLNTPIFSNVSEVEVTTAAPQIDLKKFPITFVKYQERFDAMLAELNFGNTYLINLTQPTAIASNLDLEQIFDESRAKFKLLYQDEFVVFSPERFVKITGKQISTNPMKGTIDATLPNAEAELLANEKEIAEHNTIVDLLRNDLNQVAKKVRVNKFRYVDKIETASGSLLQVSSEITGEMPDDWHQKIGDIFMKLLPAGSVTGAPKKKTVEIIKAVEGYQRGWYTGIFGIFDGESLDSAVMIRFIEKDGSQLIFKSGGGITTKSDVKDEYSELIQKVYVPIVRDDSVGRRAPEQSSVAPSEAGQKP